MKTFAAAALLLFVANCTFAADRAAKSAPQEKSHTVVAQSGVSHGLTTMYWHSTGDDVVVGPGWAGQLHVRYPYYSYRRPWFTPGPKSLNVTIVW